MLPKNIKENNFKRQRIRIKDFNYTGYYAYFVTICTFDKQRYFVDGDLINNIINYMKEESEYIGFKIYAYCFMPDHLHLILISDEGASLVKCIKSFKQKTEFYFKKKYGKQLWQKSYFDHVIRRN